MRSPQVVAAVLSLAIFTPTALSQVMRGKVAMPDGSPLTGKTTIERFCQGTRAVTEATVNKHGEFLWRMDNNTIEFQVARMGNRAPVRCYLRARMGDWESDPLDIGDPTVLNRPQLPTMVLHKGVEAAAEIPRLSRSAAKAWDLGMKAMTARQWPEVEKQLREVTRAAPGFSLAWSGLGYAYQSQQKLPEAREAYQKAVAADPKSLLSHVQLVRLEISGKRWQEAAAAAEALIAVDKDHRYPEAHLHRGMARYFLKDYDSARASLDEAVRLDSKHEMPQAEYLMGAVLAAKGDREGAATHLRAYLDLSPDAGNAAFVRDQIARLTRPAAVTAPEPSLPVPDELMPAVVEPVVTVSGNASVPGGRTALAAMAGLTRVPEAPEFFAEFARAISVESSRLTEIHTPGYFAGLQAYLANVPELADMGELQGNRTLLRLSLAPDKQTVTERALRLLGWRIVRTGETLAVRPGDQPSDGPPHRIAAALGIDVDAMREALDAGREFTIEIRSETAALTGGSAWGQLLDRFDSLPGGIAEGLVKQPRLARAYAGLSGMGSDTGVALARHIGLRTMVNLHADALWLYGGALRAEGGKAIVPGGPAAEELWAKLAGAPPRDAVRFFEALLKADRARVLAFYAAVAAGDPAHQRFFTKDLTRAQRFLAWYRDSEELRNGIGRPVRVWRPRVFQQLPLDDTGAVRYPGGRAAWSAAASDDDALAPPRSAGGLRLLNPAPAVDLEALLAVSQLERDRGRPFDPESAALLARNYTEWHGLFPHFAALPALGRAEFQALSGYGARGSGVYAGIWHGMVELIVLARRARSLDDAAAARAFGDTCRALTAESGAVNALSLLRVIASADGDLDDAIATRLLKLTGPSRSSFEQVRRIQNSPRLSSLGPAPSPIEFGVALAGIAYATLLKPDGLLVNEDRGLLRKHQFVPPDNGRPQWFAPAALVASNTGDGSYFSGGFAGFEEIARTLASGGQSKSPALPEWTSDGESTALFHADARLVEVPASVTDERGHYVEGLTAQRFVIRENGNPVQVAAFENTAASVSCALLLDTTESMENALPALKSAAAQFIQSLRPEDPVAVYSLSEGLSQLREFDTEKRTAIRAVQHAEPGGRTALYDGLVRVIRDMDGRTGKKVIVVFTDGEDNASTLTAAATIARARRAGIPIYTIAQGHAVHDTALLKELAGMSQATGALAFSIQPESDIAGVFERVTQDILHGYLLAFRPPTVEDTSWRRIEVVVNGIRAPKVRAREGYYPLR